MRTRAGVALACVLLVGGCGGASKCPKPIVYDDASLKQIQAALKALISAPVADGDATLADSAQLREIARRLPGLQAELSALRERRAPRAGP